MLVVWGEKSETTRLQPMRLCDHLAKLSYPVVGELLDMARHTIAPDMMGIARVVDLLTMRIDRGAVLRVQG